MFIKLKYEIIYMHHKKTKRRSKKKTSLKDIKKFIVLKSSDVKLLYKITKQTIDILNKAKIDYWAEGGTLIGAMRTNPGGFIAWDDDVDISMDKKDKNKLSKLKPIFVNKGLQMKSVGRYVKIFKPSNNRVWIDIFFLTIDKNNLHFDAEYPQKQYIKYNYKSGELFPLKKKLFGKIKINVANKSNEYLNRCYPGWKETAYLYNHHTKGKKKISFKDNPELKKPVKDSNIH